MLQRICPHCGKNVIESYGILNPYLYGSKLQKCNNCGGEFFDNRWREVAVQGYDPIQLTQEPQACQRFGLGGIVASLMGFRMRNNMDKLADPVIVNICLIGFLILSLIIFLQYLRHKLGFIQRKNERYMMESRQRMKDPEYVKLLLSHSVKVPEEFMPTSGDEEEQSQGDPNKE